MKKYIFFLLVFVCGNLHAQSFDEAIGEMSVLMSNAAEENDYGMKREYVDSFSNVLEKTLKKPNSIMQSFDSIPYLKVIASKDGVLRIFNWGVPTESGSYVYFAIVQRRMGGQGSPLSDIFVFNDVKERVLAPEKEVLQYPDWYGCLYSEIIEKDDLGKMVYTLIGFDFNNKVSYKKYIDILNFNNQGIPSFGAPMFIEDRGGAKCRIIFEYSAASAMNVAYMPNLDKIVHNVLLPIVPEKRDDRTYYVPDLAHDGFEFKFGKWMKVKNVLLKKEIKQIFE